VAPQSQPAVTTDDGRGAEVTFTVTPPAAASAAGTLSAVATPAGAPGLRLTRDEVRIEHGHIPPQTLFPAAEVKAVRFDLQRRRTRVGYIAGAGDEIPQALRQVGYQVTTIPDEALRTAPLGGFEAIVIGVRAFNTNQALLASRQRLLDYVNAGGTVVAQYSTSNRLSSIAGPIGPFPFDISQERVTDENAEVTFEPPPHSVLAAPNRITQSDFAGWTQERGLYFAGKWDPKYQTPLSMHDAGEPPRKGGLLVASYGEGTFIYTGLAFFRQLPAGVPGAFRLFANLIDHGAK
jgi:hypothetical protein